MINLLPTENKKKNISEQRLNIVVFYLYIVGTCFIIGLVSLLPSYFPIIIKNHISHQDLNALDSLPVSQLDQETSGIVANVNAKMSSIDEAEKNKFLVLENALDEVIAQKMPDIKIIAFDYDKTSDGNKNIVLHGISPNRARLLLFRQALEGDKAFSHVDLPISNFVKGSNIDFTLNLAAGTYISPTTTQ